MKVTEKITESDLNTFGQKLARNLSDKYIDTLKNTRILDYFPIIDQKQALYLIDWTKYEISYTKGIKNLLGYDEDEFDLDSVINYIHPDDMTIVSRVIKGTLKHATQSGFGKANNYAMITFRMKKKDGSYIYVLRKSVPWEIDINHKMLRSLSILTDISFMQNTKVEWDVSANTSSDFKKNIYKEFVDFFTKRELDIIRCIAQNCTNEEIAEKLFISYHTVKTHRKKIFKKANCHNKQELLEFCSKNRIL